MDEYQKQLARQNNGKDCEHCGSKQGHHCTCPLINREAAEERSRRLQFTEADTIIARTLGVQL